MVVKNHKKDKNNIPGKIVKPEPKKGLLGRLKENIFKHKKKIAIGLGIAATAGAAAYAYNKHTKIKKLEEQVEKTKKELATTKKKN